MRNKICFLIVLATILFSNESFTQCFVGLTQSEAQKKMKVHFPKSQLTLQEGNVKIYKVDEINSRILLKFQAGVTIETSLVPNDLETLYSFLNFFDKEYIKIEYGLWVFKFGVTDIKLTLDYLKNETTGESIPFCFTYSFYKRL